RLCCRRPLRVWLDARARPAPRTNSEEAAGQGGYSVRSRHAGHDRREHQPTPRRGRPIPRAATRDGEPDATLTIADCGIRIADSMSDVLIDVSARIRTSMTDEGRPSVNPQYEFRNPQIC